MPSSAFRKPKALFLSAEAPYPMIGGGALRSASLLEYLASRYALHSVVFRQPLDADPGKAMPPGLVERLDVIELPYHSRHAAARVMRNAFRVARKRPPLVDRFSGCSNKLSAILAGQRYETAIIEHFWCAPYVEQVRPQSKTVILDLHNIESVWHRSLATFEDPLRSWALRRFATASAALERRWLPEFDWILATSPQDAQLVRGVSPKANVMVYPNALPCQAQPARRDQHEIVFSGNLEYSPNIAAIRFFHRSIWPTLERCWPELRWRLIGKNPDAIRALVSGHPRIVVTGYVEDAVAALAQSQVAVIPLRSGSGTRFKILEAWAAGTPIVSTAIGAEGLDCLDGTHLVIADDPHHFAEAVSRLLAAPEDRLRIGMAGRCLLEERYTWPIAWRTLDALFGNSLATGTV